MRGNDSVHALVQAQDRIRGAGLDAQRAAYAPVFVDDGHGARCFLTMLGTQGLNRAACDGRQARNALGASGRALVDAGLATGDGQGVCSAVGIAAARALGLGQGGVDACRQGPQRLCR